jgi:GT2 family glycosyltransferase
MNSIVFVVLHYETLEDTKKCLDSLLQYLPDPRVQVVAVDNGSPNGKLEVLAPAYEGRSQIHFLYSRENLGFARGNNLGFRYAKKELQADLIILANNDLVFEQADFVDKLISRCRETGFDVAGPKILSLVDGKNQNPVAVQYRSIRDVNKRILKNTVSSFLCNFDLDKVVQKVLAKEVEQMEFVPEDDFQLHGACMFFANRFVESYDGLCDKTFMYGEESILKYMVVRDGMKMEYLDDVTVYHKEGSSTGVIYGKGKAKRKFFYKWNIDGCKQLKRLMEEDLK